MLNLNIGDYNMKKHTKYTIVAVLALSVCVALILCTRAFSERENISKLNQSLDIDGIQILTAIEYNKEDGNPNYYEEGGFGGRFFHQIDNEFYIVYSGHPDVLDDFKLTDVRVKKGNYSVFGLKIGSDINHVKDIMSSNRYEIKIEGQNYRFKKGDISIVFYTDNDGVVLSFLIQVTSTNKDNVVF